MKKWLLSFLLFLHVHFTNAQSSTSTLDVVSWNLEFFGAPFNSGPTDKDLQEINVKKIMRYLDADIYGLVEIVDSMRLRRLVDSLGNTEYGYFLSPFCSNNTTGTGGSWTSGQKLSFIYRKSIFSNISVRGLLRSSSSAYTNWASGRFPYMFSATVTINGTSRNINFIVIHGKAGSTVSDYDRRLAGAEELKDTLDAQFSSTYNMIIGDYNDALNRTISSGTGPESSYHPIIVDSTDADHYKSITLPLALAGQTTMINFPNVIDNHVISNEVTPYYVLNSAQVRTDVINVIPNYVTAHNTSDHYPVFSKYSLDGIVTSVPTVPLYVTGLSVFPNPFNREIQLKSATSLSKTTFHLTDIQGRILYSFEYDHINAGSTISRPLPYLSPGIYFLQASNKNFKTTIKLIHY